MFLFFLTANAAHAQQDRVNLPRTRLKVEEVIAAIQNQTNYVFAFDRRMFDVTRTVDIPSSSATVEELANLITSKSDCSWLRRESYIVIHRSRSPAPPVAPLPPADDGYTPSDPNVEAFSARPQQPSEPAAVTATPPPAIVEFADPFSAYRDPDIYHPIKHALPRVAAKTDLLYCAATLSPNIGLEWGLTPRSTVEFTWGWNQWNHENSAARKLNHRLARLEYRRWFCERYNGHFVGAHLFGTKYNVGGYDVPDLFERRSRYEGWAFGAGVSYGYHLALSTKWGIEFQVGLGVVHYDHTRFECVRCGTVIDRPSGFWFGPTRAGVDLVFML